MWVFLLSQVGVAGFYGRCGSGDAAWNVFSVNLQSLSHLTNAWGGGGGRRNLMVVLTLLVRKSTPKSRSVNPVTETSKSMKIAKVVNDK